MAYYALHKLRILPGELLALPKQERAFIYAAVQVRLEAEKRERTKKK